MKRYAKQSDTRNSHPVAAYLTISDWQSLKSKLDAALKLESNTQLAMNLLNQIKSLHSPQEITLAIIAAPLSAINIFICNNLIQKFSYNFRNCQDIYEIVIKNNCANTVTYNTYIVAANKNNEFDVAHKTYNRAKQQNAVDEVTYASMIAAAGKNRRFLTAHGIYIQAKDLPYVNAYIFNSMIDAANINNKFSIAKGVFIEAKKRGYADVFTFVSFIDCAGKHNQFSDAQDAYLEANEKNLVNENTFASFIDIASKNQQFDAALTAFKVAKNKNLVNTVTLTSIIDGAGKNHRYAIALEAYQYGRLRGLISTEFYASFIAAAGINRAYADAQEAYQEAQEKALVDIQTHINFMTAAGNNQQFAAAQETYSSLSIRDIIDHDLFCIFITAAGKTQQFAAAYRTYEDAKRNRRDKVGVYTAILDACLANNQYDLALSIFTVALANHTLLREVVTHHTDRLNLRGLAYASAYISLFRHLTMRNGEFPQTLTIIPGSYPSAHSNPHHTELAIKDFLQSYSIPFRITADNPDEIICNLSHFDMGALSTFKFNNTSSVYPSLKSARITDSPAAVSCTTDAATNSNDDTPLNRNDNTATTPVAVATNSEPFANTSSPVSTSASTSSSSGYDPRISRRFLEIRFDDFDADNTTIASQIDAANVPSNR